MVTSLFLCPEQESNLHASRHAHLKRARLPFRHLGKKEKNETQCSFRAENETRTRDPNLGKVVLYQLSYFRLYKVKRRRLELPRLAALPPQSSASTNSATSPTMCLFSNFGISFEVALSALPPKRECKGTSFFHTDKTFRHFFRLYSTFFLNFALRNHQKH